MDNTKASAFGRARQLTERINALMRLAHRMRQRDAQPNGAFAILAVIGHHREMTGENHLRLGAVCHMLHRSMPSITRSVNSLERDGLVVRTASTQDRRGVCLSLTEAGAQALEQSCSARFGAVEAVLNRMGDRDAQLLLDVLSRLIEAAEAEYALAKPNEERNPYNP